jgi:hypothetical protein
MTRRLALHVLAAFAVSCGSPSPLEHTSPSASELARTVLRGLENRDREALDRVALNEREFRDHVWPQLPAARPERNLPFSYVWGDLRQKSAAALSKTLSEHGGRRYELIDVQFDGETDYATYLVHRDATFRVRDANGAEASLRLCGSMLERNGVWKVFSYVVD